MKLLAWIEMHESPAVSCKWHPESPEEEMTRAFNAKKYVDSHLEAGRDILAESLQDGTAPNPG